MSFIDLSRGWDGRNHNLLWEGPAAPDKKQYTRIYCKGTDFFQSLQLHCSEYEACIESCGYNDPEIHALSTFAISCPRLLKYKNKPLFKRFSERSISLNIDLYSEALYPTPAEGAKTKLERIGHINTRPRIYLISPDISRGDFYMPLDSVLGLIHNITPYIDDEAIGTTFDLRQHVNTHYKPKFISKVLGLYVGNLFEKQDEPHVSTVLNGVYDFLYQRAYKAQQRNSGDLYMWLYALLVRSCFAASEMTSKMPDVFTQLEAQYRKALNKSQLKTMADEIMLANSMHMSVLYERHNPRPAKRRRRSKR